MRMANQDRRNLITVLVLLLLCVSLILMAMPERERLLVYAILWPLALAVMLLMAVNIPRKTSFVVWAGLIMAVWSLFCNVINGDSYLQFNLRYVYGIALAFGVGLPLFPLLEERWEKWLPAFLLVFALYTLALAAISCYACLRDRLIQLPYTEGTIGITAYRLYAFQKHPNEIGCLLNLGLLSWIMLAFRANKWWLKIPCVLALLPVCFALSLTVSRTAITLAALAMGGSCLVAITRKPAFLRWVVGLTVMTLVFAATLWTMMTGIPQMLPSGAPQNQMAVEEAQAPTPAEVPQDQHLWQRSYTDGIGTFSMRTEIWQAGIQYLKDRPITLLIGSTDGDVARIPGRMLGRPEYHLHNAWLEVLLQAGLSGLLIMAAVFLRMFVAAARLFFSRQSKGWLRVLAATPVLMTACTLMETYPAVSANVTDMMMLLLCGAVIAADHQCIQAK